MACTYYTFKSSLFGGDYWCDKKKCAVNEDIYYKYCRDYNYDECSIYKQGSGSGCFITTVTCEILGNQDNAPIMNNLRCFRDNVLQNDSKYYDILKEYDVIGPKLADCIRNDKDKEKMALGLYQNVLVPVANLISEKEYDKAVEKYYVMTLMLVNYYGLKHDYNDIKDDDYGYQSFDPSVSGHGRKLERKI